MAIRRSACAVRGKATYRLTRKHHPKKHPSGAPLPVAVETSNSPRIKHLIESGWLKDFAISSAVSILPGVKPPTTDPSKIVPICEDFFSGEKMGKIIGSPLEPSLEGEAGRGIWVCLKIGYIPNYSHLIGIMISKTIGCRGTQHFQTHPFL